MIPVVCCAYSKHSFVSRYFTLVRTVHVTICEDCYPPTGSSFNVTVGARKRRSSPKVFCRLPRDWTDAADSWPVTFQFTVQ